MNKTIPAPLTIDEVYDRLCAIHEYSTLHREEWRNQVARDLNHLIGRAVWWIETDHDESDRNFGAAILRIAERVAEIEKIERAKRE